MDTHETIRCTRAQFAEATGMRPSPESVGVCIVSPDGKTILQEFIFTDEPYINTIEYQSPQFLSRTALPELCQTFWPQPWSNVTEIIELERLYKL